MDIEVTPLSRLSLNVTWNPPTDQDSEFPVTQYRVSLYAVIQAVQALETKSVNGTMKEETTFDGLKDNTTYWFRVAAENAIGPGPYSGYVHYQIVGRGVEQ